jgi:hypothetical protein
MALRLILGGLIIAKERWTCGAALPMPKQEEQIEYSHSSQSNQLCFIELQEEQYLSFLTSPILVSCALSLIRDGR